MPSQLYNNSAIAFICARNFTYAGVDYTVGQDFPQEDLQDSPEVLVRSRYLIPVVDDWTDKPRHWYREVQLRGNVLAKLGKADYMAHPETKVWKDEETRGVGPTGEVTEVGTYVGVDDSLVPGSATQWDDVEDAGAVIHESRLNNIREAEMSDEERTQQATFVNGEEQSEPIDQLGLGDEAADAEIEVKEVPEAENVRNEHFTELVEGNTDDNDQVTQDEQDEQFDPADHTAAEVHEYLDGVDDTERDRVLDAERSGKNRKGLVGE